MYFLQVSHLIRVLSLEGRMTLLLITATFLFTISPVLRLTPALAVHFVPSSGFILTKNL